MKKFSLAALLLFVSLTLGAQHTVNSFFDEIGAIRSESQELNLNSDTLPFVFSRTDDVVWSRVVYRVIDLRYRQNFQLYFPVNPEDKEYKNMFRLILDAIIDGMPVYAVVDNQVKPDFSPESRILPSQLTTILMYSEIGKDYSEIENHYDMQTSDEMLIHYDSVSGKMSFHSYQFKDFVKNQFKYLIQEVIYFDKHTCTLNRKLMAIAPMYAPNISSVEPGQEEQALLEQRLFWIAYDHLRPYLAKQYLIPQINETKRVTYEEFFQKRLYTSYIIGEDNMYDRMILDYCHTEKEAKQEQARMENELLTFEQDLWEY